ncbi:MULTISPECIES: spore coat protein U domain-containing protein [unclassified Mesorhizobium]|uniref:Csu type fimbrial protein n=1 Tax=unclassified Mesorhizobium TaxID=325217 RepID=UPI0003D00691|nr:spore coat protein U domain-containing protein [Mesorhizobium sp. L103C105A0]ESZ69607.1 Spore coat protein U [Mesorhizobium sp. L103C105A0]
MNIRRQVLRATFIIVLMLLPSLARAQSCSYTVTSMNFGLIDTLSGTAATSTATLSMNCSGSLPFLLPVLVCPHFASGTGGASSAAARQMANGANSLNYQLYSDPGMSVVWGSYNWAYASRPPPQTLNPNLFGNSSGTATIYGRVPGGQSTVPPGTYLSTFSSTHVEILSRTTLLGSSCSGGLGNPDTNPTFTINATVAANCLVTTQNIDFGSKGVLTANADATGQVSVTCTPSTAYTVSLNGGTTGGTPTNRKMSKGAERVTYGLYKDAARSQPWGDAGTPGSTVAGTGTGTAQALTVYGRVPPQTTPSAGVYTDTVVVTITY